MDYTEYTHQKDRALRMYLRAREYCLRGLDKRFPKVRVALLRDPKAALARAKKQDVQLGASLKKGTANRGGVSVQVTARSRKITRFAVSVEGIYYVTPPDASRQNIQFLNFSTGQSRPVVVTDHEIGLGLSLSPDGRFLIFRQRDQTGSDLMLVENFSIPR